VALGPGDVHPQLLKVTYAAQVQRPLEQGTFALGQSRRPRRRHQRGHQHRTSIAKPPQQKPQRRNVLVVARPPATHCPAARALQHQAQVRLVGLYRELGVQLDAVVISCTHVLRVTQTTDIRSDVKSLEAPVVDTCWPASAGLYFRAPHGARVATSGSVASALGEPAACVADHDDGTGQGKPVAQPRYRSSWPRMPFGGGRDRVARGLAAAAGWHVVLMRAA